MYNTTECHPNNTSCLIRGIGGQRRNIWPLTSAKPKFNSRVEISSGAALMQLLLHAYGGLVCTRLPLCCQLCPCQRKIIQLENRLIPVRKNLVSRERRSGNASGNKARSSSRIYRESSRRTVVPLDGVTGWGFSRGRHDGVDNIGRSGYVLHSAWD